LLDLATLLERCRQGDDLAWEALVRRYQSRVYALAFHYMRDAEEARDVAQEVFIRIYRRRETLKVGGTFVAWMLKIARNLCIDSLRRRRSRPPASDLQVGEGPEIPSGASTPEEASFATARRRLVHRAMDGMSDKNREIILLRDIQGLALAEISDMLDLPLGTVKSRSHRARIELAGLVRTLDPSYGT